MGRRRNTADMILVAELMHGEENAVYTDASYTVVEKRDERVVGL